ncbi:MAG: hypothetical protein RLZZ508_484 [Actinomycetota bacterium]|jgi:predicted short-subunit dehydrogenase-like oxidoreductase (DUF2520 family)
MGLEQNVADMAADAPPVLKIGLIGAGRVGIALSRALQNHGHSIVAAHAVSEKSKQRVLEFLPATDLQSIENLIANVQTVLFAVPDDVLPDLVRGIAQTIGFKKHQFVIHTSGRFGIDVLAAATAQGAIPMAIHPAMTFTGAPNDVDRIIGCPFAITTNDELLPIAAALVLNMGGREYVVAEEDRSIYHAALSHAANHSSVVVNQSKEILQKIGIENPGLFLSPLVNAAIENSLTIGIDSLTGPIVRGDVETVRSHILALKESEFLETYRSIAVATVSSLRKSGKLSPSVAEEVLAVLK